MKFTRTYRITGTGIIPMIGKGKIICLLKGSGYYILYVKHIYHIIYENNPPNESFLLNMNVIEDSPYL